MRNYLFLILLLWFLPACNTRPETRSYNVLADCYALHSLSDTIHTPQPGEWRATHTEVHVPLKAYIRSNPPRTGGKRSKLYVLKVGDFDASGNRIYAYARKYLSEYYQIEVDTLSSIGLQRIPAKYTRKNEYGLQLQTRYLLDSILPPLKQDSAFALIAFSLYDLFPDEKWNFVFGQASLNKGLGIWSLARLGDYRQDKESFDRCLERTLKIAIHETGHMLGIEHCGRYECCMNGSNSMLETDLQPAWFCWECLAKLCWNRDITPQRHLKAVLDFHRQTTHDAKSIAYYQKALSLLPAAQPNNTHK